MSRDTAESMKGTCIIIYRSNSYFMICMVQSTPYHGAALIIIIIIIHNHYEFFDDIRDTSYTCAAAWITRCDHGIN